MRGFVCELDLAGRPLAVAPPTPDFTLEGSRQWRSPDGVLECRVWNAGSGGCVDFWQDVASGLVVVADAMLYDRDRLLASLGPVAENHNNACVLACAYQRWGQDMLAHLDGDYAFVVLASHGRDVFAAVDPAGMRSMFFRYRNGERLSFSTDMETLARRCELDPRIPESRLLEPLFNAEHLAHSVPEVAGIDRLLAAHSCCVDKTGLHIARYWSPGAIRPAIRDDDMNGWIDGLREVLGAAVRKRTADGVRVGVQFSGGLDSSTLLALARGMVPEDRLVAYALLDRSDQVCPETLAIDRVLAYTGARAVCVDLGGVSDYGERARALAAKAPRFVLGRNGFLLLFDQMAAASGVDVMMNGLDADALFHEGDLLERQIRAGHHADARRNVRKQDRSAYAPWMAPELKRMRYLSHLPWQVRDGLYRLRRRVTERKILRDALLSDDAVRRLRLHRRFRESWRLLLPHRMQSSPVPTNMFLSPWIRDGAGRNAAVARHCGIEMRCPFLDRALMDFSAWIPLDLRMRNGRFKWILRKAMNPYLPHNVVWRGDKYHLGSHFDRVMLQSVLEQAVRDFHGSGPAIAPYVDRERFLYEAERWQAGKIEAVWKLKMPLLLENWLRHNSDKVRFGH